MAEAGIAEASSEGFRIRAGLRADIRVLVEFQIVMALETEDLILDPATVHAGVTAVFDDPTKGEYWVAEDADGRLLGCLLTLPEWSDWRNGTVLWIHSVHVVPEARRRGVFRRLYGHLRERVEASTDLRGLRLYVDKRNLKAQRVYSVLGMADEHYQLYEWMVEGEEVGDELR